MNKAYGPAVIAGLLLVLFLGAFMFTAQPAATAQSIGPASDAPILYNFVDDTYPITGTFYSATFDVARFNEAELQTRVVFSTGMVNTTTLTLQYSNNGLNWFNDAVLASSVTSNTFAASKDVAGAKWRWKIDTTNDQDPVGVYIGAVMQ